MKNVTINQIQQVAPNLVKLVNTIIIKRKVGRGNAWACALLALSEESKNSAPHKAIFAIWLKTFSLLGKSSLNYCETIADKVITDFIKPETQNLIAQMLDFYQKLDGHQAIAIRRVINSNRWQLSMSDKLDWDIKAGKLIAKNSNIVINLPYPSY